MSNEFLFLAADGDNIGETIDRFLITNDIDGLQQYSLLIKNGIDQFAEELKYISSSHCILVGGDSIIIQYFMRETSPEFIILVRKLQHQFNYYTGKNITIAFANTLEKLFVTLKYAKTLGENQIIEFVDESEFIIHTKK